MHMKLLRVQILYAHEEAELLNIQIRYGHAHVNLLINVNHAIVSFHRNLLTMQGWYANNDLERFHRWL